MNQFETKLTLNSFFLCVTLSLSMKKLQKKALDFKMECAKNGGRRFERA